MSNTNVVQFSSYFSQKQSVLSRLEELLSDYEKSFDEVFECVQLHIDEVEALKLRPAELASLGDERDFIANQLYYLAADLNKVANRLLRAISDPPLAFGH